MSEKPPVPPRGGSGVSDAWEDPEAVARIEAERDEYRRKVALHAAVLALAWSGKTPSTVDEREVIATALAFENYLDAAREFEAYLRGDA
jgi:hypothetical protein